jgi:polar amino acid transport system substrate-binding protein
MIHPAHDKPLPQLQSCAWRMPFPRCFAPALAVMLALCLSPATHAQELVVQADNWCPYNCQPGTAAPGYAIEMLQAVFEHDGRKIKYEIVPWDRALLQTREGMSDAAVAATRLQAERNGLLVGHETVGYSSDCLYVAVSNRSKFSNANDLDALNSVAIVSGYTYAGAFGAWLARPENKRKILVQRGEKPAEVNARNVALGRLDGVIENSRVMALITAKLGLAGQLAATECEKQTPLYVAFSPKLANVGQIIKQFDDGIARLRRSKELAKILAKYGQSDWK